MRRGGGFGLGETVEPGASKRASGCAQASRPVALRQPAHHAPDERREGERLPGVDEDLVRTVRMTRRTPDLGGSEVRNRIGHPRA